MRKLKPLGLAFVLALAVVSAFAQGDSTASSPAPTPAPETTTHSGSSTQIVETTQPMGQVVFDSSGKGQATAANDSTKKKEKKDLQNQTQFLQSDMESKNYNFYNRRAISTPLMMRYDLDSAAYQSGKKKEKQQKSFLDKQYAFPAKPRDQWELSGSFGGAYISGNVKPYVTGPGPLQNIGGGFNIRKALGYVLSIRLGYTFMEMTGRNWQPDQNLEFNTALNGEINPKVNYLSNQLLDASRTAAGINMNDIFFYNYRAYAHEAHLDFVFNLGNISYHRERTIVNFYAFGGFTGLFFTTYTNALNSNGQPYDFSRVFALYDENNNNNVNTRVVNQKKEALQLLNQIYDNSYETPAEHANDVPGIKNWTFEPTGSAGVGVQFHATKWFTVGIEERVTFTYAHVDGYFWQQDNHPGLVPHYDNISYTALTFNIHLGNYKKTTEPLYWLNPVYHSYRRLNETDPNALMEQMFKDDDDDGVPNYLDRQPNTPKGCPVDAHGVALDSDHDGIIDCLDKEPYSPPGYPVDSNGVAIIPPNPCCDTTGKYNNGGNGGEGGENGLGGIGKHRGNAGYDCSKIELPAIVFDEDKYYLDPQYFGNLHQIAERMQMCPDMRLVVTGYDESRNDQKYNEQLGWNRSNSAVDYLVEKYGISRDRFIIKYQGGKKAATGTPFEKKMKNKVEFRYANEGESGESNPPSPHPGLKAGSNK